MWAAIFLVSGLILGATSLIRPGLVRDRNAISEDVEIKREIIDLRELLVMVERMERNLEPESTPEETANLPSVPQAQLLVPEVLAEIPQAEELDGNNEAQQQMMSLVTEQARLISELEQLQGVYRKLQEDYAQLNQDNRRMAQKIDQLRGYQTDYQQRIERRRESLQEHLARIRKFEAVEDTFSLEDITLSYLGQTINFQELDAELARNNRNLTTLRGDIRFLENSFSFALVLGMANLLVGFVYYWLDRWNQEQARKMRETDEKIEEAQLKIRNFSWNMANASLEKYYQRNLMEVQVIFMTSVVVMILGFLVILASLALALSRPQPIVSSPESSSEEQVIDNQDESSSGELTAEQFSASPNQSHVATIGVVAGIITNFIGATFMLVYRSTVREASRYSNSLNRINDVGIAMDILNTSAEHGDSPEILAAKVEIAKRLVESDRHPDVD